MTQAELEQIATNFRAKGLHLSWAELIKFSNDAVGGLVDAYQTLLKNPASSNGDNTDKIYLLIRDRLSKVLISLTSPAQVARWESEVLGSNCTMPETVDTSIHDTK